VGPLVCFDSKKKKVFLSFLGVFIYSVFLSVYSTEVYTAFIWLDITYTINRMQYEAADFKEETVIPLKEIVQAPEQYPTDMTTI